MKYKLVIIALSLLFFSCKGQQKDDHTDGKKSVTFVITNVPSDHDFSKDIYISGDFEGWSGGRAELKLEKKDKTYQIRKQNAVYQTSKRRNFCGNLRNSTTEQNSKNSSLFTAKLYKFKSIVSCAVYP